MERWKHWARERRGCLIVLAAFLAVSFLFWRVNAERLGHVPDTGSYTVTARSLLREHAFNNSSGPDTNRTIGYPLFLSAVFALGGGLDAVVAAQIVLSALCLYLVFSACRRLGAGTGLSTACCAAYLVDLTLLIHQSCVESDVFFYDMLVVALYFLARYQAEGRGLAFVLFALFVNAALAVRPILIYYNLLLALALIVLGALRRIRWRLVVCYCALFALLFVGWSARNYRVSGVFEYSSIRNYNLLMFDGAELRSDIEGIPLEEARARFLEELEGEDGYDPAALSEGQLRQYYGRVGGAYIKAHFPQYLLKNARGLFTELFGPNRSFLEEAVGNRTLRWACMGLYMLYLGLVYALYAWGFLRNIRALDAVDWFIFTVSGYCAAASASLGYARFRAAWFGLILAGAFLLLAKRRSKAHG